MIMEGGVCCQWQVCGSGLGSDGYGKAAEKEEMSELSKVV